MGAKLLAQADPGSPRSLNSPTSPRSPRSPTSPRSPKAPTSPRSPKANPTSPRTKADAANAAWAPFDPREINTNWLGVWRYYQHWEWDGPEEMLPPEELGGKPRHRRIVSSE